MCGCWGGGVLGGVPTRAQMHDAAPSDGALDQPARGAGPTHGGVRHPLPPSCEPAGLGARGLLVHKWVCMRVCGISGAGGHLRPDELDEPWTVARDASHRRPRPVRPRRAITLGAPTLIARLPAHEQTARSRPPIARPPLHKLGACVQGLAWRAGEALWLCRVTLRPRSQGAAPQSISILPGACWGPAGSRRPSQTRAGASRGRCCLPRFIQSTQNAHAPQWAVCYPRLNQS